MVSINRFARRALGVCLGAVLCAAAPVWADEPNPTSDDAGGTETEGVWLELDPTVVSATAVPQPKSTLGTSTTVITAEEMAAQGIIEVRDALELSPGAHVATTGQRGSLTSLFLRGGNSDFTQVLIDGVPVTDVGGFFDFGALTVDNIERIEVVRGAQSALYGADAMSGVVNIVTKKGEGPPTLRYDLSGGTRETFRTTGTFSGGTDRAWYSVGVGHTQTANRAGVSNDRFNQTTFSARAGTWLGDDVEVDGSVRIERASIANPGPYAAGIAVDIDDDSENRRVVGSLTLTHHITDTWEHRLRFGLYDQNFRNRDDSVQDPFGDFLSDTKARVDRHIVNYQHSATLAQHHTVTVGAEYEEEEGSFEVMPPGFPFLVKKRVLNRSVYAQVQSAFLADALNVQAGVRYDNNSGYGTEASPRVAVSYLVKQTGTRVHASWGEGIKNPDIFDLASPFGANPNIKPEKTTHWDAGVEQSLHDGRILVDVTYFAQYFEDLIVVPAFGLPSQNLDEAAAGGIEASVEAQFTPELVGQAAYTFLETEDAQTGADLLRRPKHTAHVRLTYDPGPWYATVAARMANKAADIDFNVFPARRVHTDSYVDLTVVGGYRINDRVEVYGRVENALDREYETAYGFEANGATAILGVRGTL